MKISVGKSSFEIADGVSFDMFPGALKKAKRLSASWARYCRRLVNANADEIKKIHSSLVGAGLVTQKGEAWVGVDLDGTLAFYQGWDGGKIGEPIPAMVNAVKEMIDRGKKVKIFTARVCSETHTYDEVVEQRKTIEDWTEKNIGKRLEVTCVKDQYMVLLIDDRCQRVELNTGKFI